MQRRDDLTRRSALALAGAGAIAGCAPLSRPVEAIAAPAPATGLFRHGVASGDPLADQVVIWTRVTAAEAVETRWRVARNRALTEVVATGEAVAALERDGTVKIDVAGLEPGTDYFYVFEAHGERSSVGRTRTLPAGPTPRLRLAVVSCSNHPSGYFHVYRDIADRAEADLVLHLGDYIYEYGPYGYGATWGPKNGRNPDPAHETLTLADYRRRHAQYKSDPDLQAAHAAAPWILIWDDHEVANDAWTDGAEDHSDDEGPWRARRDAALQAYMEWTPIREPASGDRRDAIERTFDLGDLATLVLLEARHGARSRQISWDDAPLGVGADPDDAADGAAIEAFLRDTVGAPEREMLGAAQQARVEAALARSVAAQTPWRLVASPIVMAPVRSPDYMAVAPLWLRLALRARERRAYQLMRRSPFHVPLNLDQWDGYPAARERLYASFRRANAQPIVLSGDVHSFMASRLFAGDGAPVGVELTTSAVSSPSAFVQVPDVGVDFGRLTEEANAHVLHHNGYDRGYIALELTPDAARAEMRCFDTVEEPVFRVETKKVFEVRRGEDGMVAISEAAPTA
jgi:phosphodiesterase/alkaline phosphatase D-like protein